MGGGHQPGGGGSSSGSVGGGGCQNRALSRVGSSTGGIGNPGRIGDTQQRTILSGSGKRARFSMNPFHEIVRAREQLTSWPAPGRLHLIRGRGRHCQRGRAAAAPSCTVMSEGPSNAFFLLIDFVLAVRLQPAGDCSEPTCKWPAHPLVTTTASPRPYLRGGQSVFATRAVDVCSLPMQSNCATK